MRGVKIKDVANLAGVSTATVSHVTNNTRFVGAETRQKVLDAIDRTGYQPNIYAQHLAAGNNGKLDSLSGFLDAPPKPQTRQVFLDLSKAIARGEYQEGEALPDEAALMKRFALSRPAVKSALKELREQGLIQQRKGLGWFVRRAHNVGTHLFGLLIPGLGQTEIFEPICQGMARAGRAGGHALLWGDTTHTSENSAQQAKELCQYYISRDVSGIFFAPLELSEDKDDINNWIIEALENARIPVVLLDRDLAAYPRKSRFDLVGIDNRRAGFIVTEHLLSHGCQRLVFFAVPNSAPTVAARHAGFRDALAANGLAHGPQCLRVGYPEDLDGLRQMLTETQPDGLVCANDITAALALRTLDKLSVKVPQELRIVGFDDVKYAGLLTVPLTTIRQPCPEIGEVAISLMLDRIAHPNLPARDILLDFNLVTRDSCGCPSQ